MIKKVRLLQNYPKNDGNTVVLDLGKLEGVMPLKEQIPTETYNVNDKIRGYVLEVEKE